MTRNNNTIYVREGDPGEWSCFCKSQGDGFILDQFESKEDAVSFASRVLYALNKYGPLEYTKHDYEDAEFDNHPEYPVVVEK